MNKSMPRPLRVGQLGCNGVAHNHAAAHQVTGNTKLVAAYDVDPQRTAAFVEKYNLDTAHATPEAIFQDDQIDLIDLVTPDRTHVPLALEAIACGKHVLIEKPIAWSLEEVDQVMVAARERGVSAMSCQSQRWVPKLRKLVERVHAGDIGEPVFARCWGGCPPFWSADAWPKFNSDGRIEYLLLHNGMHSMDMLCWLLNDKPTSVYTLGHPGDSAVPLWEYFNVNASFSRGAIGLFEESRIVQPQGYPTPGGGMHVIGTEGTIVLEATCGHAVSIYNKDGTHYPGSHVYMTEQENYFGGQMRAYADSILQNEPPPISLEFSRMVLAGVLAAVESFKSGQPVEVDYA